MPSTMSWIRSCILSGGIDLDAGAGSAFCRTLMRTLSQAVAVENIVAAATFEDVAGDRHRG